MDPKTNIWKERLDKFLVFNLFLLIVGAFLFLGSIAASANGHEVPYNIFQKLWFPLFIPALSLFFTAVLIEAVWAWIKGSEHRINQ